MPAKAIIHRDEILRRVANGDRLVDIAQAIGLADHTTISRALADYCDYRRARTTGLKRRIQLATMAHARREVGWHTLMLRRTLARWEKEAKE